MTWPTAGLDPVRQLRVMAAVLPGVGLVERVLSAPFESVWQQGEDMETTVPAFAPLVGSSRIAERDGERLVVRARAPILRVPTPFEVELRPGWCWMQSRFYVVGMAARPEGSGTRYAQLEGVAARRAPRLLRPVMRRLVAADVAGLERLTAP